jgi:hypothetical protein
MIFMYKLYHFICCYSPLHYLFNLFVCVVVVVIVIAVHLLIADVLHHVVMHNIGLYYSFSQILSDGSVYIWLPVGRNWCWTAVAFGGFLA